jgi:hypothetical protein
MGKREGNGWEEKKAAWEKTTSGPRRRRDREKDLDRTFGNE